LNSIEYGNIMRNSFFTLELLGFDSSASFKRSNNSIKIILKINSFHLFSLGLSECQTLLQTSSPENLCSIIKGKPYCHLTNYEIEKNKASF
ncbi:hypothetical protein T11_2913, partial [Trichinella zimbabwensis]